MTAQFAIIRFPEGWRLLLNGKNRGRFNFQIDATEAALRLADELRRAGRTVEILVQDMFGELVRMTLPDLSPKPA